VKVIKVSTGTDGQSHFRPVPAGSLEHIGMARLPMEAVLLRRTVPVDAVEFHHPSGPMWIVTLAGSARITCGDGSSEVLEPGDVLWADDVDGQGHRTEELSEERFTLVCKIGPSGTWPDGLDA
jgi:mannose-6-phosphate isomerase-like protein (cupin superfamily)